MWYSLGVPEVMTVLFQLALEVGASMTKQKAMPLAFGNAFLLVTGWIDGSPIPHVHMWYSLGVPEVMTALFQLALEVGASMTKQKAMPLAFGNALLLVTGWIVGCQIPHMHIHVLLTVILCQLLQCI
jgi:hypothetical protein